MEKERVIVCICFCVLVLLLLGCEGVEETIPEPLTVESEELMPESQVEEPESESETQVDARSFLEKEKETDPIFDWEDPLSYVDYLRYVEEFENAAEGEKTEEEIREYEEYIRNRHGKSCAESNYSFYYYYLSGRSEYDGNRVIGHRDYPDLAWMMAGPSPESFIANAKTQACVVMRPTYWEEVTVERKYSSKEEQEKMEKMGEEPTYQQKRIVMTVDEVLWGEFDEEGFVFLPGALKPDLMESLTDPENTLVAFVYEWNETYEVEGVTYTRYNFRGRGLFELQEGKLEAWSNLGDVARFDGKTPDEMIAALEELIEKYPELV